MITGVPHPDMPSLWADTFHDSEEYIRRIFHYWVDMDLSMTSIASDGSLQAMLCVHKFAFTGGLRGGYLHGLATAARWRRKGLMATMIRQCASRASAAGMDFLFLIPADGHLRQYYARLGFLDVASRNYISIPMDIGSCRSTAICTGMLAGFESGQPAGSILHSLDDMTAVTEEWREAGGEILTCPRGGFVFMNGNTISLTDLLPEWPVSSAGRDMKIYLTPSQYDWLRTASGGHPAIHTEPYAMVLPLHMRMRGIRYHMHLLMD